MALLRLTDITQAQSTAITPTTLVHIVTTGDTSQNGAGSSYKAELSQIYDGLSGYCMPQILTSFVIPCSPLGISPNDEGNVYFGSTSGLTVDVANSRVGVGTITPTARLHIVGSGTSSSLNSLYIADSASTATFILRDDGGLIVGKNANTSLGNSNSLTIGSQSLATGTDSVAVGHLAAASGAQSSAFGKQTVASGTLSVSLGNNNTASATSSISVGTQNTASSQDSLVIGQLSTGSGLRSVSIGNTSQSTSTDSIAIGSFTKSSSDNSTTIGFNLQVGTGTQGAIVMGYGTAGAPLGALTGTVSNSLALGWNSTTPSFLFSKSSDSYLNGSGNVGIGTATPTAKLHISGGTTGTTQYGLKIDDSNGQPNFQVRDDGVIFFGNDGIGGSKKFISAGFPNDSFVSVGYGVLDNFTQDASSGIGAVAFGLGVFQYLPSNREGIGFGYNVFSNPSLSSNRNIGFGRGVGTNVTSGTQNLIFGYNTANNFTTGDYNIQMAHQVGGGNYSSTLAFGHDFNLKESNTIMFGGVRQYKSVQWDDDVTDGTFSFSTFTEKIASVANASTSNTNGWDWTYEGSKSTGQGTGGAFIWKTTPSGVTSSSTQNTLVEAMRITGEGNIGIGTSSPSSKLEVVGTTKSSTISATTYQNLPTEIQVAASDETTALTTGTAKVTFRMPYAMTVTEVRGSLTTAQASGNIFTVDINESSTSILSTKLTIDNTEKTSVTATTPPVISDTSLADDAEITVDIDQIGDGTATGLKITIKGFRA